MKDNDHIIKICVAPELRSALIKYMAKHDLDKQFAVLHLLTKALHSEQLISKEVYEVYSFRYSRKLVSNSIERMMTQEQLKEKQLIEEKTRIFSMVLDQWHLHGEDWRNKWIKQAEEWKDKVPNAKLILDLGGRHC
ncbi:MAG: hypothetical protein N3D85_07830 [Candidatus Bathyarchaeota archaeon]|nr:hypothetical protein [Candidatus Bathyarchaeota archaeon]